MATLKKTATLDEITLVNTAVDKIFLKLHDSVNEAENVCRDDLLEYVMGLRPVQVSARMTPELKIGFRSEGKLNDEYCAPAIDLDIRKCEGIMLQTKHRRRNVMVNGQSFFITDSCAVIHFDSESQKYDCCGATIGWWLLSDGKRWIVKNLG